MEKKTKFLFPLLICLMSLCVLYLPVVLWYFSIASWIFAYIAAGALVFVYYKFAKNWTLSAMPISFFIFIFAFIYYYAGMEQLFFGYARLDDYEALFLAFFILIKIVPFFVITLILSIILYATRRAKKKRDVLNH